ncbi:Dihydroneopterin aldolase / delta 1-pyrroline-5-carboxylate synthetase [Rubellimicrobium mesophilum DSM 19309]|uniref:dihydroneopterin aldolase n=1 Tax=Rubellimicrobium mesophilum DSM 19309 TaxID=442562 RepID=A0A017HTW8_9RHOB|nr:dihydroneopterin aldolase [Rubellimicrobium mesophilum]EYD77785.1 Dihydroneopterin aldolase / delta 1-pyrroline-5-carboxylate synthetase [Rubellimicrobium mesophilum DSM 19309]
MTSDDLRTAFGPLTDRAEAMAGPDPLDRISLRDHLVEVEIGAFQVERGIRQRLRFDIVVEVHPLGDAGDDVDRILSYDKLAEAVAAGLAAERLNLLETLAERVAARILREPQAERVFLRIEKLDRGPGDLGVEVVRSRREVGEAASDHPPRPRVVLLGGAAPGGPDLSILLDRPGGPLVLCVDGPDTATPVAGTEPAQRHIDLLALDQAAWALASRDARLLVVGTRTELDWALRQGLPSVWAPSKMVLDAVGGPEGADPLALAAWLAGVLGATELRLIGREPPDGFTAPVPVATGLPKGTA